MTVVAVERSCPQCSRRYRVSGKLAAQGGGRLCPWCTKRQKQLGSTIVRPAVAPVSNTALQADWPTNDDRGGTVVCAGPGERHTRPFGVMCSRCEWRAFEQPVREEGAA